MEFISFIMKIEATCSSEITVDFQRITRHYIPEDRTLCNHRCEGLKSYELRFLQPPARSQIAVPTELFWVPKYM
jgi:hypothetical protein